MAISKVYNIDCMEYMKNIPDKYYDLAVVDPPYGINIGRMSMGVGKSTKSSNIHNRKWSPKDWDSSTPSKAYFAELFRISKNQIIWGGNYFDLGKCQHFIVWDKEIPLGLSFSDCEFAWTNFNKANRIFRYSAYLDKKNKVHPTQKPVKLYEWIYLNYAKQGDKILDTHLGSGSSRIAAYKLGFDFVGCEIDKEYFDAMCKRFNNECLGIHELKNGKKLIEQNLF